MRLYEISNPTESQDPVMSRFLTSGDYVLSTDEEGEFVNVFKGDSCAFGHCEQGIFGPVLLVDCGLTEEGRKLCALLAKKDRFVSVCTREEVPGYLI